MSDTKAWIREQAKQHLLRRIAHYLDLDHTRALAIEDALSANGIELDDKATYEDAKEAEWLARCVAYGKPACFDCWNRKPCTDAQGDERKRRKAEGGKS